MQKTTEIGDVYAGMDGHMREVVSVVHRGLKGTWVIWKRPGSRRARRSSVPAWKRFTDTAKKVWPVTEEHLAASREVQEAGANAARSFKDVLTAAGVDIRTVNLTGVMQAVEDYAHAVARQQVKIAERQHLSKIVRKS